MDTGAQTNPFEDIYIKPGSVGVQAFMNDRIQNANACLTSLDKV
jgi:hypothetical protein